MKFPRLSNGFNACTQNNASSPAHNFMLLCLPSHKAYLWAHEQTALPFCLYFLLSASFSALRCMICLRAVKQKQSIAHIYKQQQHVHTFAALHSSIYTYVHTYLFVCLNAYLQIFIVGWCLLLFAHSSWWIFKVFLICLQPANNAGKCIGWDILPA